MTKITDTVSHYIAYKKWQIERMTHEIESLERMMTKKEEAVAEELPRLTASEAASVVLEAHKLVHGNRGEMYGHPLDDMTRTAGMINALLGSKLAVPLKAEDVSKIMVLVKLSREENRPKRDNRVDGAGYFETLDMIVAERARRDGGNYA